MEGAEVLDSWLEKSLFGVLQDRRELPLEALRPLLDQAWGLLGRFRITHSLGKKFVFRFDTEEERDLVLENAPWAVDGMFLMLKPLDNSGKGAIDLEIGSTPIWVQIRGLPLELLMNTVENHRAVGEMFGATAGEVVKVEPRGRYLKHYTRVLVLIDPEVPLVAGQYLRLPEGQNRSIWVEFSYERVFKLCHICGRIGHKKQSCDSTPEEAKRAVRGRVDEAARRLGCGVLTDGSRPLYTRGVRAHHRGSTWGSKKKSNRVIFFDEGDGTPPVDVADFDDEEDPPLTIYMKRKRVEGGGGGEKVVFERSDIDPEEFCWVRESKTYWRVIGGRR